jgi:pimeloyl-ACP methyl ester carboxylesterase
MLNLVTLAVAAGGLAVLAIAVAPALSGRRAEPLSNAVASDPSVRFLDRPEGRIAYDDRGRGPLVVMVPGMGDVRTEYRFLAPRLVEAGFRVVTMDLRGHGQSTTGWSDYSSSALGSDVVALVRELDAGPATLIGTSMGAAAVAWGAAEAPDDVSRLVLIGPFVREIPPQSWLKGLVQTVMIRAAFAGPWARSAWGLYYDSLYPSRKPADHADYRARLLANLAEPGRMEALKTMMRLSKADVEARLHEVRAPTLIVMGTKDPDFPDAAAEARTVAGLLHGTVWLIEGAGHYPQAEMPEIAAPAILDFLRPSAGS